MFSILNHIVLVLQSALVPVLIIVILVLVVITLGLLRELQRLWSLQRPLQHQPDAIRDPQQWHQPLSQPPRAAYANPSYSPAEPPDRAAVVQPSLPSDIIEPARPSRPNSSNADDPLNDKRWLKLVEECIGLFDDLDRHLASFDPARQALAEHVLLQLQEILERSNVELITDDTTFERRRHQPEPPTTGVVPGTPIIKTLSPGFAVERRVLRRARVRVAEIPTKRNEVKRNEES